VHPYDVITAAGNRPRRIRSATLFKHQFRQDNLTSATNVVAVIDPVLFVPVEDGRDLASLEGGELGRRVRQAKVRPCASAIHPTATPCASAKGARKLPI